MRRLLRSVERPLLVAGGGVVLAGATGELRLLAERLGAAATATPMGLGIVSTDDPGFFGHGGLIGGEPVIIPPWRASPRWAGPPSAPEW